MIRKIFFLISMLSVLPWASAQETAANKSKTGSYGLFENDDVLEITLRFDVTTYLRKKPIDEFLKADLIINPGKPDSISKKVRIKTRGEFRRRYCSMAPIELNLKKVDFGYSDLDSIDKLKLVTQCSFGLNDESYLLREYLVYKLFNAVTDTSFRVRLLRVNYIDNVRGRKPMLQWGIFIEPVEMLAERTNMIQVKTANLNQKHIIPFIMDRMALFNYMIGNYDWSIPGQHNVKVFKQSTMGQLGIAIPYDFDWTGIVNAAYAIPTEETGLKSVRDRLYLGICRKPEVFERQLNLLNDRKDEFYNIINEFPYLKPREKQDITGYLDTFFEQLKGNHNNILSTLRNNCKNF